MMDHVDSSRETATTNLQVQLEILRGRAKNKIRRVEVPVFLIGSAHDCDLVLADASFPEVHTYLYVNRGGVSVRRLGEGPQIRVDGQEVQASPIVDGQTLHVGPFEFAVRIQQGAQKLPRGTAAPVASPAATAPRMSDRERESRALVRSFLDDVRAALRVESNLRLYVEHERACYSTAVGDGLTIRKATA
jgi:predicted component of type VI protein secretion system